MIKQENGKFVVYSESGKKFGTYDSESKAKQRLAQMEMFKHMKKTASAPGLKNFFASEPACIVHGAGKECVMGAGPKYAKPKGMGSIKKAELNKQAFDLTTAKGAKVIYDAATRHLVKSYAKHGGKGVLREFKNQEIVEAVRQLAKMPQAKNQRALKSGVKSAIEEGKETFKSVFK